MLKKIILLVLFSLEIFAQNFTSQELSWESGDTLLGFLQKHNVPQELYYRLDSADKELMAEIGSGSKYLLLKDESGHLQQALIPVTDELQIHIYKTKLSKYRLELAPIFYHLEQKVLKLFVKNSAYEDVFEASGSTTLARSMSNAFKKIINFKNMKKGDEIVLVYEEKRRLGKLLGQIDLKAGMIEVRGKKHFIFGYKDSYYNAKGNELNSFLFITPLHYKRISDYFSKARFHPILKRYRAHLGVDFAARRGTVVRSAGNGKVVFKGRNGGYGKAIKIKHLYGYTTLYAHLSRYAKIRVGQRVKQGQIIGYVGSTGLSTGPHLHLGVYLHKRAINPLSVIKKAKVGLSKKQRKVFFRYKNRYEHIILNAKIANNPAKEQYFNNFVEL